MRTSTDSDPRPFVIEPSSSIYVCSSTRAYHCKRQDLDNASITRSIIETKELHSITPGEPCSSFIQHTYSSLPLPPPTPHHIVSTPMQSRPSIAPRNDRIRWRREQNKRMNKSTRRRPMCLSPPVHRRTETRQKPRRQTSFFHHFIATPAASA